jgi:hypothetical protein
MQDILQTVYYYLQVVSNCMLIKNGGPDNPRGISDFGVC